MRFRPPEGGCASYVRGTLALPIALPEKAPFCQYCPMAKYEDSFRRYSCRAVREENWLFDPFSSRPDWCPVQFETEG